MAGEADDDDLEPTAEIPAALLEQARQKSEPPPMTVRVPGIVLGRQSLPPEDANLVRTTEKTLSVATRVDADRATLTVLTGLNSGQILPLEGGEHILGRGTGSDLWIEEASISRRHACVTRRPDGNYVVQDLGSTNGTFVSGCRIDGSVTLKDGDRIQIGPTHTLRFGITDAAELDLQRRLYESSTRDALTKAFNRKYLNERLAAEIAFARRHNTQLALLMLDLDHFKEVNDSHGHLAGDTVLRAVAGRLLGLIRIEDVLARYGGEEFVILARSTSPKNVGAFAERVRSAIERLQIASPEGKRLSITVSIGLASLSELPPVAAPMALVSMADARLYRAKAAGRNRVCTDGGA